MFLAAYRQVTLELTGTPEGRLDWPALWTDGRTAQRLARAGHRRYSGGVLLSILTFHNCRRPKELHHAASTTRWTIQLRKQEVQCSKLGRDTDKTSWRSSLFLWISSGLRTRSYSGWATNVSTQNFQKVRSKSRYVNYRIQALNLIKLYRGTCKDEMSSGTWYDAVQTDVVIATPMPNKQNLHQQTREDLTLLVETYSLDWTTKLSRKFTNSRRALDTKLYTDTSMWIDRWLWRSSSEWRCLEKVTKIMRNQVSLHDGTVQTLCIESYCWMMLKTYGGHVSLTPFSLRIGGRS